MSTTNGEVIEQMFHVSHLKKGLLRLPNSKTVKNINDYILELTKHANDTNRKIETNDQRATNSSQTSVKSCITFILSPRLFIILLIITTIGISVLQSYKTHMLARTYIISLSCSSMHDKFK